MNYALLLIHQSDNINNIFIETRVKKARQVHTLSGCTSVLAQDQGGTGESVNNDFLEIRRKSFLGREMKHILDPIEEIDEESSKEFKVREGIVQHNTEDYDAGDRNSISKKISEVSAESKDMNESNYQLRRTVKLIDLHHEFIKEDLKVILGPKRMDSSSSDSCDEDNALITAPSSNESTKIIVTSNRPLVHSGN